MQTVLSFHFSKETEIENTLLKTAPEKICLALYVTPPKVQLLAGNLNIQLERVKAGNERTRLPLLNYSCLI